MNTNNLMTELPRVAAKELQNTHFIPQRMKAKMDLLKACYTAPRVVDDFREWCRENRDAHHKYPIIEYIKVIDSRMGGVVDEESTIPVTDPRVMELAAFFFDKTGRQAPRRSVARLLVNHTPQEIQEAATELMESLTADSEIKGALHSFFHDGGAEAIIIVRRKRAEHGC